MRSKTLIVGIVIGLLLAAAGIVVAGGLLDPANPPGTTSSYTLESIYQRLIVGTAGAPSTFTEPLAGPGSTMHTLDEIMGAAPAVDNTNGATAADVVSGKTFWGLRSDAWGPTTGTAAQGTDVLGADGSKTFNIPDGFYASKNATANDTDLVAGNIKSGVDIFGVAGSLAGGCTCTGTLNGTRWCDNLNGTVTDLLGDSNGKGKCLVWLQNAAWGSRYAFWVNTAAGTNAHDRAASLKAGAMGASLSDGSVEGDWRLPTITELSDLANGTEAVRSSNMWAFTGVQSSIYWTSTTDAGGALGAWYVHLSSGAVGDVDKPGICYVWPVRGGQ